MRVWQEARPDPDDLTVGSSDPSGNCSDSFLNSVRERKLNTDKEIDDFLAEKIAFDFDLIRAPTIINAALGGLAAPSFGGRSALQELLRLNQMGKAQPFKLFVSEGSLKLFQLRTVLKTSLITGIATNIAYEAGAYAGSALYAAYDRSVNCK